MLSDYNFMKIQIGLIYTLSDRVPYCNKYQIITENLNPKNTSTIKIKCFINNVTCYFNKRNAYLVYENNCIDMFFTVVEYGN